DDHDRESRAMDEPASSRADGLEPLGGLPVVAVLRPQAVGGVDADALVRADVDELERLAVAIAIVDHVLDDSRAENERPRRSHAARDLVLEVVELADRGGPVEVAHVGVRVLVGWLRHQAGEAADHLPRDAVAEIPSIGRFAEQPAGHAGRELAAQDRSNVADLLRGLGAVGACGGLGRGLAVAALADLRCWPLRAHPRSPCPRLRYRLHTRFRTA